MIQQARIIPSKLNDQITFSAVPGHFATRHSHINFYVDLTEVKMRRSMAKLAASELAKAFLTVPVDTVVCMDGTEVIGAYLADELVQDSGSVNLEKDLCLLNPELNTNKEVTFRENNRHIVDGRDILLLVPSSSTGTTIENTKQSLEKFGGRLTGVGALFSAVSSAGGVPVAAVFHVDDLPGYQSFVPGKCDMCTQQMKIDAIASSYGYTLI